MHIGMRIRAPRSIAYTDGSSENRLRGCFELGIIMLFLPPRTLATNQWEVLGCHCWSNIDLIDLLALIVAISMSFVKSFPQLACMTC